MLYNERQNEIINILKRKKNIKVGALAKALYVSEATVRRDLAEMQKLGLIERNHGGAILLEVSDEISMFVRMNENAKEKETVAAKAIPHIPEFKSVFVDSSSTALALAQRLDLTFKTVVTNNLQSALLLSRIENINLVIPGGNIAPASVSITGSRTSRQLESFHFDLMLASCAAVKNTGAYEKSLEQSEIKSVAFENSDKRILLADSTKFDKSGAYLFKKLSEFDLIVTDRLTDDQKSRLDGMPIIC